MLYVIHEEGCYLSDLIESKVYPFAFKTYLAASEWLLNQGYKAIPNHYFSEADGVEFWKEGDRAALECWICEIVEVEVSL